MKKTSNYFIRILILVIFFFSLIPFLLIVLLLKAMIFMNHISSSCHQDQEWTFGVGN